LLRHEEMLNFEYMNLHQENHEDMPSSDVSLPRRVATHRASDETNRDKSIPLQEGIENVVSKAQQHQVIELFFTLSIPEVRGMLIKAGHPVSERTVIRWCTKNLLTAILRPEENGQYEKYYVNEESVAKKIGELNRVRPSAPLPQLEKNRVDDDQNSHQVKKQHAEPDNSFPGQSNSKKSEGENDLLKSECKSLKRDKLELERKLMNVEIEKQAAHHVRDHLVQQNTNLIEDLQNKNYALGKAEGRLQLLDVKKQNFDEEISPAEPMQLKGIRKYFLSQKKKT